MNQPSPRQQLRNLRDLKKKLAGLSVVPLKTYRQYKRIEGQIEKAIKESEKK